MLIAVEGRAKEKRGSKKLCRASKMSRDFCRAEITGTTCMSMVCFVHGRECRDSEKKAEHGGSTDHLRRDQGYGEHRRVPPRRAHAPQRCFRGRGKRWARRDIS